MINSDETHAQTTVGNKSANKKSENQQIYPNTYDSGEEDNKTIEPDDDSCQLNDDIVEINSDDQYKHNKKSNHRNTSNSKKDKKCSKKSNDKDRSHPKKNHGTVLYQLYLMFQFSFRKNKYANRTKC